MKPYKRRELERTVNKAVGYVLGSVITALFAASILLAAVALVVLKPLHP